MEVVEDGVLTDEGAIAIREDLAEHSEDAGLRGAGVMAGAFVRQVALTRHEMLLTATAGDGYVRPYDRGTTWSLDERKKESGRLHEATFRNLGI